MSDEQKHSGAAVQSDQPAAELGRLARTASALVSITAGVAGAIGVFTKDTNSGGVPVLLVLAAFFGYLAISGQRVTHLKVAGHEAGFDRVARAAGKVLQDPGAADTTKGEVAEALEEVRAELPVATRRSVSAALDAHITASEYEDRVLEALQQIDYEDVFGLLIDETGSLGWDAALSYRDREIYIDIRYLNRPISRNDIAGILARVGGNERASALLISNQPVSSSGQELLDLNSTLGGFYAQWRTPADNNELQRTISAALSSRSD